MDYGGLPFEYDMDTTNWRWRTYKYFKQLDYENTFLTTTIFIFLSIITLIIFSIVLVFIEKFKPQPNPSPYCDFRTIESEPTLESHENPSFYHLDLEPEVDSIC